MFRLIKITILVLIAVSFAVAQNQSPMVSLESNDIYIGSVPWGQELVIKVNIRNPTSKLWRVIPNRSNGPTRWHFLESSNKIKPKDISTIQVSLDIHGDSGSQIFTVPIPTTAGETLSLRVHAEVIPMALFHFSNGLAVGLPGSFFSLDWFVEPDLSFKSPEIVQVELDGDCSGLKLEWKPGPLKGMASGLIALWECIDPDVREVHEARLVVHYSDGRQDFHRFQWVGAHRKS